MARKLKELVRLREKKLANGNISLYLDIYFEGNRQYKFLKLYLIDKPRTELERGSNKSTLTLAQNIRAKRQLEIQNSNNGVQSAFNGKTDFFKYFQKIIDKIYNENGNYENRRATLKHLKAFTASEELSFDEVTPELLEEFKQYLLNKLSKNSARSYLFLVSDVFNRAKKAKIISNNPMDQVEGLKKKEVKKEFLSIEEVQSLAKHECKMPELKPAFLFSCLTGLRWSDVYNLTWGNVHYSKFHGWHLKFEQEKTEGIEITPIPDQARELLGEKGNPGEKVFKTLKYNFYLLLRLRQWAMNAGITKDIGFHTARHTFATLQLTLGTDLYTVSKMLGHKEIKTTQVYAKIVDQLKIDAASRIPNLKF